MQIKTESGSKVKATKMGIYTKWKEHSHHKVSLRGTSSDGGNAEMDQGFAGIFIFIQMSVHAVWNLFRISIFHRLVWTLFHTVISCLLKFDRRPFNILNCSISCNIKCALYIDLHDKREKWVCSTLQTPLIITCWSNVQWLVVRTGYIFVLIFGCVL